MKHKYGVMGRRVKNRFRSIQCKMERSMSQFKGNQQIKNSKLKRKIETIDEIIAVLKPKWNWASYVARLREDSVGPEEHLNGSD